MDTTQPLLMIPGPIEVSPAVKAACGSAPPSHVAPALIEAFGDVLTMMRQVWRADASSQPFVVAGSGTLAMEMAAVNLMAPGEHALVVNTGYFSLRMAEMLRRRGVVVTQVDPAALAQVPDLDAVDAALTADDYKALFVTHVDTSTGVRVDAEGLAALATKHGALSVFDGICATAGEAFEMAAWGADVYLTASQKAIGLPPGLALMVASDAALRCRAELATPPPLSMDWHQWQPIMQAYEDGRPSYFATPATSLILGLHTGLREILATTFEGHVAGVEARVAKHAAVAQAMQQGWSALGLELWPDAANAAHTLSAIRYPEGVGPQLLGAVREHGVIIAGGLYPGLKETYFRVGHMGYTTQRPWSLLATVAAIGRGLQSCGRSVDVDGARARVADLLDEKG